MCATAPWQVFVGTAPCPLLASVSPDHNIIVCTAPQGVGDNIPITVVVGGRASAVTANTTFRYDPPVISGFPALPPNAAAGGALTISGRNFGFTATPVQVTVGGLPCDGAAWGNDARLTCTLRADVVGTKNVSILAANRTVPVFKDALIDPRVGGLDEASLPSRQSSHLASFAPPPFWPRS